MDTLINPGGLIRCYESGRLPGIGISVDVLRETEHSIVPVSKVPTPTPVKTPQ